MSFAHYLAILKARRWLVLSIFLAAVAAAVVYLIVTPRKYESVASIVLDVRTGDPLASANPTALYTTTAGYVATQLDVMQSERVAARAAERLKLTESKEWKDGWEKDGAPGTLATWIGNALIGELKVAPSPDSSVIQVSYRSTDPRFAADVANAFVRGYIDTTLDLRTEPAREYNAFFEDRARQARADLERVQARLSSFQQEKGLLQTDEKSDIENARLAALANQVVEAEAAAAGSAGRGREARRRAGSTTEALSSSVLSGLKADVARQRTKLRELSQRLGPAHPQYIETQASIAELDRRILEETSRVSGSVVSTEVVDASRVNDLRAALDRQRQRVMTLKVMRDEAAVLERDVDNARRVYDSVVDSQNKSALQSQATQTNVNVLRTAIPANRPSTPKVPLVLGIAAAAGALLAALAAMLREATDRRLRVESDVTRVLRQPLIAIMPPPSGVRRIVGRSTSLGLTQRALPQPGR